MILIWSKKIIKKIITSDRIKLNAWMKKNYPSLTLSHLQKLCRTGQIRVNGGRIKFNTPLIENDEIKLPPFIHEYENTPDVIVKKNVKYTKKDIEDILKTIIYQDDEILVINKPAGLASQGGTGITKHIDTLINIALPEYNNNLRLTHRIDKETSGILVIAKDYDSAVKMTTLFKEHKIHKSYTALVYGNFDSKRKTGTIKAPIMNEFHEDGTNTRKTKNDKLAKYAITNYKVIDDAFNILSMVELTPLTGRMHQLRIHMNSVNHSIVGDFKYGQNDQFKELKEMLQIDIPRNLYLHAGKIEIEGKPVIKAPLPEHFVSICKFLNF